MVAAMNVTAREDMEAQIEESDGYAVNLDRLWRAVGCPLDEDPRRWAELAEPYLRGVAGYFRNLEHHHVGYSVTNPDPCEAHVVFEVMNGYRHDWKEGEMGGGQFAAYAYAGFLDGDDAMG